jgi:integrase
MFMPSTWNIDQTMILTRGELHAVLADLSCRSRFSLNARLTLVIMRLACCCGLRVSEVGALRLDDVRVGVDRPHLRIRRGVGKGRRARTIPLWWDAGTLADVAAWKAERQRQGATASDLFVCSMLANRRGEPLSRHALRLRFQRACRSLGPERIAHVTIHHGRHTFVSHALAGGRTLAEVRDAAGHSHVGTTSLYAHVAVEDDAAVGNLFCFEPSRP